MISIIILNWNGKDHLLSCLSSLHRQSIRDFEIILVDNGSTDGSCEWVRENFPDVEIISLRTNTGFCVGNNIGMRAAKGELIALLNNDTEVSPDWLLSIMTAAKNRPDCGFFASKIMLFDNRQTIDTAGDGFHVAGIGIKRGWLQEDNQEYSREQEVFGACGGAAIYRRSMLDKIGFLDEDFFANAEDIDLSFRAQLAGFKCLFVPEAIVYHKGGATIGKNPQWFYLMRRNILWVLIKNMPLSLFLKYCPRIILYHSTSIIYHIANGRGKLTIKAYFDAFRLTSKMIHKRRANMALKVVSSSYLSSILDQSGLLARAKQPVTSRLTTNYKTN